MSYNLFLDDLRIPVDGFNILYKTEFLKLEWIVVRSHDAFVKHIEINGLPELISFDHDLADEHYAPPEFWDEKYDEWAKNSNFKEKTGHESAKWLVDYCLDNKQPLPKFFVHSMNTVGRQKIQSLLDNFTKFQKENGN